VQAWDRYAYANNNTLKYTDPSGHKICDADGYCGTHFNSVENHGYCLVGGPLDLKPCARDDSELSWGGERIYKVFLLFKNTHGWWNADGDFTLAEFVGLWILTEAGWGTPNFPDAIVASLIAQVVAQNLYVGGNNPAYCKSESCWNGVFNYMWKQSQGGDSLLRITKDTISAYMGPSSLAATNPEALMAAALRYGNAALHPTTLIWDGGNDVPINWGNNRDRTDDLAQKHVDPCVLHGPNDPVYFYCSNFYLYSANQAARDFNYPSVPSAN
jgi:hypothetical protein